MEFTESQREALGRLLADDDEQMLALLEEQFLAMGQNGLDMLHSIAADTDLAAGDAARQGARSLLAGVEQQQAWQRFTIACQQADRLELEPACWLLAATRYPDLDAAPYRARLEQMAQELRERLTGRETPRSTIEVMNHYLFQLLGFRGNRRDYYDPDNSYLNRVLDRRLGIPVTLAVVYLLIGQRLNMPLHGVNMPGHFLVKWQAPAVELFIDPYNHGRLLRLEDCRRLCLQLTGRYHSAMMEAVALPVIVLRMCRNLQRIYVDRDDDRAVRLAEIIELFR